MMIAPLTPAVFHVLLALSDGPLHGYGVLRSVRDTIVEGGAVGPSTIYGTLDRLVHRGWVAAPARAGAGRRRYTLTPAGHRALWAESGRLVGLAALVTDRGLVPTS